MISDQTSFSGPLLRQLLGEMKTDVVSFRPRNWRGDAPKPKIRTPAHASLTMNTCLIVQWAMPPVEQESMPHGVENTDRSV